MCGLQARLMSQAMRKLTSVIGKTNTVCVFINQLREKVGIVYGNPEVTTGGRLNIIPPSRLISAAWRAKDSSASSSAATPAPRSSRTKVAPPRFPEAEFDIMFGGSQDERRLIDVSVKLGIVRKAAHGSTMATSAWARAATTQSSSSRTTLRSPTTSRARSVPMPISSMPPAAR